MEITCGGCEEGGEIELYPARFGLLKDIVDRIEYKKGNEDSRLLGGNRCLHKAIAHLHYDSRHTTA